MIARFIVISVLALAFVPKAVFADSEHGFCERTDWDIKRVALDPASRLDFANQGGMFNGGVCWWHSRFQRAGIYLAHFMPDLPKPTLAEAKKLIFRLSKLSRVVEIPGYSNFNSFTRDWGQLIQKRLNAWQREDGIAGFAWVDGLKGRSRVKPTKLKRMMDELYEQISWNNQIVFQRLQVPGIPSHAWLVINMLRTPNGYELDVIDSNLPSRTVKYVYTYGMTHFLLYNTWKFVPYTERVRSDKRFTEKVSRDIKSITNAISRYCRK